MRFKIDSTLSAKEIHERVMKQAPLMALAILENLQMDDNKKFEEVMKEMNLPVDTLEKMRINLI